ncbi:hypothetical protein [Tateyamaria sp.]|uniref:hypothetical protein n=1 Tax=Tateyamaria sp. TaxID=1929288 RepID=UPI0032A01363
MIPSISPHIGVHGASFASQRLNTDQTDKLSAILSNYDTKSLDGDAAKKIVAEIKDAGIGPGAGLANALADNGIGARDLRAAAGLGGPAGGLGGPPAGGPSAGEPPADNGPRADGRLGGVGGPTDAGAASVDAAVVSLFEEAATIYESDETGQTFAEIVAQRLESEGLTYNQPLVDFRA